MRKYSHFISNNSKGIYNNTSININKTNDHKIENIIKYRKLKKRNLVIKSIIKRKKIKDKFLPKNDIFFSQFRSNSRHNKTKKETKQKREEEKNPPFQIKMLDFQKKMNKTNYLINNLKEENKLFYKGYQKALLSNQKDKIDIKAIETNRTKAIHDLYHNNVFNMSLLLTKKKRVPNYILESLDNNESKEDLKIIENIKHNFIKGKNIKYPDFINFNRDEKKDFFNNIIKMKNENKLLEQNISNYEKNWDSFNESDLNNEQSKELNLIQKRLSFLQKNGINKGKNFELNDSTKAKSTKNIKKKFIFSSPEKGEYKLVTKCEVKDKLTPKQQQELFETYSTKLQFKDFCDNYNRSKALLEISKKGLFYSDLMSYNNNINNLKRKSKQLLKKKFNYSDKYFDSLSSCLESFTEKNSKEKDIVNLYSFMKKGNLMDVKDLMIFYKKKYGKDYAPENVISGVRKHEEKYNIVGRMYELNKLNNFLEFKDGQKRKVMLENIKKLDEEIKSGGIKFTKRILDFN